MSIQPCYQHTRNIKMGIKVINITMITFSLCSHLMASEADDSSYNRHTRSRSSYYNALEKTIIASARKLEASGNPAFKRLYEIIKDPETPVEKILEIVSKNKKNPYWDVLNESAQEFIIKQTTRASIQDVQDFSQDKLASVAHLLDVYDRIELEGSALSIHCLRPEYTVRTGTLTMTDQDTDKEIKPTRDSYKVFTGSHAGISMEDVQAELNARYAFLIKRYSERNQQDLASVSQLTINISDLCRSDYIPWHIEAICEQNLFPKLKRIVLITDCLFDHQGERSVKEYLSKKKLGGITPTLTNHFSCSKLIMGAISWCARKSVGWCLRAISKRLLS